MAPSGLLTDLYELNMAASYLQRGWAMRRRSACSSGSAATDPRLPGGRRPRAVPGLPRGVRPVGGGARLPGPGWSWGSRTRCSTRWGRSVRRRGLGRSWDGSCTRTSRCSRSPRRSPSRSSSSVPAQPDHLPDDDRVQGRPVRGRGGGGASSTSRSGGRRGSTRRSRPRCSAIGVRGDQQRRGGQAVRPAAVGDDGALLHRVVREREGGPDLRP